MRRQCSSAGTQGRGNGKSPRKPIDHQRHRPPIPTCENSGVTRPEIEPGPPWLEASSLTAQPPYAQDLKWNLKTGCDLRADITWTDSTGWGTVEQELGIHRSVSQFGGAPPRSRTIKLARLQKPIRIKNWGWGGGTPLAAPLRIEAGPGPGTRLSTFQFFFLEWSQSAGNFCKKYNVLEKRSCKHGRDVHSGQASTKATSLMLFTVQQFPGLMNALEADGEEWREVKRRPDLPQHGMCALVSLVFKRWQVAAVNARYKRGVHTSLASKRNIIFDVRTGSGRASINLAPPQRRKGEAQHKYKLSSARYLHMSLTDKRLPPDPLSGRQPHKSSFWRLRSDVEQRSRCIKTCHSLTSDYHLIRCQGDNHTNMSLTDKRLPPDPLSGRQPHKSSFWRLRSDVEQRSRCIKTCHSLTSDYHLIRCQGDNHTNMSLTDKRLPPDPLSGRQPHKSSFWRLRSDVEQRSRCIKTCHSLTSDYHLIRCQGDNHTNMSLTDKRLPPDPLSGRQPHKSSFWRLRSDVEQRSRCIKTCHSLTSDYHLIRCQGDNHTNMSLTDKRLPPDPLSGRQPHKSSFWRLRSDVEQRSRCIKTCHSLTSDYHLIRCQGDNHTSHRFGDYVVTWNKGVAA
ncbi:hypothetical protein PR048_024296 [Dryococelus australis]|uniref:Uncharacterized protein n=1 Tax=Dryococelus australis TaxID=614101 RepID=A0ABQ9GN89_9NEOP|nr:hypothetical protein PR048_024296 [Dryococelus australis]